MLIWPHFSKSFAKFRYISALWLCCVRFSIRPEVLQNHNAKDVDFQFSCSSDHISQKVSLHLAKFRRCGSVMYFSAYTQKSCETIMRKMFSCSSDHISQKVSLHLATCSYILAVWLCYVRFSIHPETIMRKCWFSVFLPIWSHFARSFAKFPYISLHVGI